MKHGGLHSVVAVLWVYRVYIIYIPTRKEMFVFEKEGVPRNNN